MLLRFETIGPANYPPRATADEPSVVPRRLRKWSRRKFPQRKLRPGQWEKIREVLKPLPLPGKKIIDNPNPKTDNPQR